MPITNPTEVSVSTTAVLLAEGSGVGYPIALYNSGAKTAYLGGASVTKDNGIPLVSGGLFTYDLPHQDDLYAVCTTAESTSIRLMFGLH